MKVVQGTLVVVLTLAGIVIFGPLALILVFAAAPQIAQTLAWIFGGAAVLAIYVVISQTAKRASAKNALAAKREAFASAAGLACYEDFIVAGGGWSDQFRLILANSQGYDTWLNYTKFFAEQRRLGVSLVTLSQGRLTHAEIMKTVRAAEKASSERTSGAEVKRDEWRHE